VCTTVVCINLNDAAVDIDLSHSAAPAIHKREKAWDDSIDSNDEKAGKI
jgi:hypothetical protein